MVDKTRNLSVPHITSSPLSPEHRHAIPTMSTHYSQLQTQPHNAPSVASPLQKSFPAYSNHVNETGTSPVNETPSRMSRAREGETRSRGLSRSSSAPTVHAKATSELHPNRPLLSNGSSTGAIRTDTSVKHLTCFWWKTKGHCKYSEDDCLYAHYDTGRYTEAPRQLVPGEPAMAGRRLERAVRTMTGNKSSTSLVSYADSRHVSRPATPILNSSSPLSTFFSPCSETQMAQLQNDNNFLRGLIDQNTKEKNLMMKTIEDLQSEKQTMITQVDGLRVTQDHLMAERETLRSIIAHLQTNTQQATQNRYGIIGRSRVDTENRCLGGLLDE